MASAGPAADALADYRDRFEVLTGQSLRECHCHARHHGGDRVHRTTEDLPAGSGYIMTPDRRSNRRKPKGPPGRSRAACAATATEVTEHSSNGQIPVAVRFEAPTAAVRAPKPLSGMPR
jgi:hypothetical protein